MSHTVEVKIELRNREALLQAAKTVGATILGEGTHALYSSREKGFGLKLNGWQYPVIIKEDGTIAYDTYGGAWGNIAQLEDLQGWYALSAAQLECSNLGWHTELDPVKRELVVFHPSGGTITIAQSGEIDANGFIGTSCADATAKLEQALGKKINETQKPEYNQTQLNVKETA